MYHHFNYPIFQYNQLISHRILNFIHYFLALSMVIIHCFCFYFISLKNNSCAISYLMKLSKYQLDVFSRLLFGNCRGLIVNGLCTFCRRNYLGKCLEISFGDLQLFYSCFGGLAYPFVYMLKLINY